MSKILFLLTFGFGLISSAKIIDCPNAGFSGLDKMQFVSRDSTSYNIVLIYRDGTTEFANQYGNPIVLTESDLAGKGSLWVTQQSGYNLTLHFNGSIDDLALEIADECSSSYGYIRCQELN